MALKRIKYVGPNDEVEIEWPLPGGRTVIKRNGHIDLPTRLAASFCEQEDNWRLDDPPAKKDEPAAKPEPVEKKGEG
jgi:hypothetical protein